MTIDNEHGAPDTNRSRHARNLAIFEGLRRTNGRQKVFFRDGKPFHEPKPGSSKRHGGRWSPQGKI